MKMQEELTQTKIESSVLPPVSGTSMINVGAGERILSVAGGVALAAWGLKKMGTARSFPLLLAGGYMILRGATGYCHLNTMIERNTATRKSGAVEASGTYLINKPRQEVYAYWRRLENLPIFMKHLAEVKQTDERRSHWKAKVPGGFSTISWEADILEDQPGEFLSWTSLPGSTIDNAGSVSFLDAPDNATEITARISYRLPGGDVGQVAASLINPYLENLIREDLARFKTCVEGIQPDIRGNGKRNKG